MGSSSDWDTMRHAALTLTSLSIPFETRIVSAHRTPDLLFEYAAGAELRGLEVIIAGAGGAAHLPGMTASKTLLPVIGVPIQSRALNGLDSLLSISQMPAGVPVATVAIGEPGAKNAALLAAASSPAPPAAQDARAPSANRPTPRCWRNPTPRRLTPAMRSNHRDGRRPYDGPFPASRSASTSRCTTGTPQVPGRAVAPCAGARRPRKLHAFREECRRLDLRLGKRTGLRVEPSESRPSGRRRDRSRRARIAGFEKQLFVAGNFPSRRRWAGGYRELRLAIARSACPSS